MADRVHHHPDLIYSPGTQVVTSTDVCSEGGKLLHPRGAVGVVVKSPADLDHCYRVRFPDRVEVSLQPDQIVLLAQYLEGQIGDSALSASRSDLFSRVIYRCVIGSQAYGLADAES